MLTAVEIVYTGLNEPQAHKAGCAHVRRAVKRGGSTEAAEVSCQEDVIALAYEDMIGSGETTLEECRGGVDFHPCLKELPATPLHLAEKASTAEKAAPAKRRARRQAIGEATAAGWELLYDKPLQGCEVGRKDGRYSLICKEHAYVHLLPRLTAERGVRSRKNWCPHCTK